MGAPICGQEELPAVLIKFVAPTVLVTGMLFSTGCGASAGGSDAEKSKRIEEMYAEYQKDFPAVQGLTADELISGQGDDIVLVDVRGAEEQAVSMIPGAITQEAFEADRERYGSARIVTYCTIGARSGKYAAELQAAGLDVRNLEGSILAWTHAGGDLAGPDGPTRKLHVYGRRWNLAADGYEAVW